MCPLIESPSARPTPDPPPEKERPWQFSLRTLLIITTAVAVYCGASMAVPLLWIGLPLLALTVLPLVVLRRKTIRDDEWARLLYGCDARNWLSVPAAIILTVPAGGAAFFSVCSVSLALQAGPLTEQALTWGTLFGSAAALSAIGVLTGYLLSALPTGQSR